MDFYPAWNVSKKSLTPKKAIDHVAQTRYKVATSRHAFIAENNICRHFSIPCTCYKIMSISCSSADYHAARVHSLLYFTVYYTFESCVL